MSQIGNTANTEKEWCDGKRSLCHYRTVKNINASLKICGKRSKKFEVKVGVDYGSIFSLLLFAEVMDEILENVCEGGVKETLHADDLVPFGNSWEEVEVRYARWKKGFKVNEKKTKSFLNWRKSFILVSKLEFFLNGSF